MNKREQRIQNLWENYGYKDMGITFRDFEIIFNEGYLTGYEVALLPREENEDED